MSSKWNEYCTARKLEFLANNVEDCTFLVGMKDKETPKEFKSFKFVLCGISPVFDRMFNGDFKEAKTSDAVIISDIYASDFKAFLDFIYYQNVRMNSWIKVYHIAKKYMADDIVQLIIKDLHLTNKTSIEVVQYLEIMYQENNIYVCPISGNYCDKKFLIEKLSKAFESRCTYLYEINHQVFLKLLGMVSCKTSSAVMFQTVIGYAIHNNLTKIGVNLLLEEIKLSEMSVEDYLQNVEPSEYVDDETKHKILIEICRTYANM